MLNTISAYWHMAGVVVIVLVLLFVPDHHQSLGYVFGETINNSGFGEPAQLRHSGVLVRLRTGLLMSAVHDHGLRCLGAHGRGDAPGLADGGCRHVHVRCRLGHLRLHPAARRHVRDPEHRRRARAVGIVVPWIWTESMSQNWAEALLFICVRGSVLLPHRVVDVRVADDVRVLARRRRAGTPALAARRANRVPRYAVLRSECSRAAVMIPAYWNSSSATSSAPHRGDRPLRRVHPPGDPPLPAWRRLRARRLEPRQALQVDRPDRDRLGRASSRSSSCCRRPQTGVPWEEGWTWEAVNYAPILVGGALLLFGGWYVLSPAMVQGTGAPGHGRGARAHGSSARASSGYGPSLPPSTGPEGGARRGRSPSDPSRRRRSGRSPDR